MSTFAQGDRVRVRQDANSAFAGAEGTVAVVRPTDDTNTTAVAIAALLGISVGGVTVAVDMDDLGDMGFFESELEKVDA